MTQPNQILGPREQASRDADEAFEKHARGKLSLPKPIRIQRKRTLPRGRFVRASE